MRELGPPRLREPLRLASADRSLEGAYLGSELARRDTQRIIRNMRISFGRRCLSVAQEPPDNLETKGSRDQVRSERVTIIVATLSRDASLPDCGGPELLDVMKRLARGITREEIRASSVDAVQDCAHERSCFGLSGMCSRRFCLVWCVGLVQTPHLRSKSFLSAVSTSPSLAPVSSCSLTTLLARWLGCSSRTRHRRCNSHPTATGPVSPHQILLIKPFDAFGRMV